jgi:hypothetical protein
MPESPSAQQQQSETVQQPSRQPQADATQPQQLPKEIGGRGGLEPTRYGDWEKDGRCIDF